jgi:hypothetical protein
MTPSMSRDADQDKGDLVSGDKFFYAASVGRGR